MAWGVLFEGLGVQVMPRRPAGYDYVEESADVRLCEWQRECVTSCSACFVGSACSKLSIVLSDLSFAYASGSIAWGFWSPMCYALVPGTAGKNKRRWKTTRSDSQSARERERGQTFSHGATESQHGSETGCVYACKRKVQMFLTEKLS